MNVADKALYKPRFADDIIERYLTVAKALCIEGPKWCGKTWTSSFHSHSEFFVGDPSNNFGNRKIAEMDPSFILNGAVPRLIDEWQEVPAIWDAVRMTVDKSTAKGQYILTGSSMPVRKGVLHSGTGRIVKIRMHTMSLFESGDSDGKVSLKDICRDSFDTPIFTGNVSLEKLAYLTVRGGWPDSIGVDENDAGLLPMSYIDSVIHEDIQRLDGNVTYEIHKLELLIRSLARNESTTASYSKISGDISENDNGRLSDDTVSKYIASLSRLFLIENQQPFRPGLRSSLRVKQNEKRHFCDSALACAALGLTPEKLLNNPDTFGFLFESMVERDLRIYAEHFGGKLYHYQDYKNNEIDAVIEDEDGEWCGIEIKLGANKIDEASSRLISIKNDIIAAGGKPPRSLCVVCGLTNAAYKRPDGVYVVPLTSLRS